jgi:hypothetical protein
MTVITEPKNANVVAGIFQPILVDRFMARVKSPLVEEPFDHFTAQIVSIHVESSAASLSKFGFFERDTLKLTVEVDTGGGVIEEYNLLKQDGVTFDLEVDNMDGNYTVYYTEKYSNCSIRNTTWFHDYAVSAALKLVIEIGYDKVDLELVNPVNYRAMVLKKPPISLKKTNLPEMIY